ncbi:type I-B CRISPR-associated protein Cas8b/Csh1 [Alicyclobacillus cycloheptanicus]|uniref:CRISPR-associated protein Csh1 n=1 Tax=Alicyclobacillus cycloheptanicus TaxID=1457 RepID=A0ABT9XLX0_9BACL|nr:type I-B CRISPR-associated protein Cas8b/Csh1 [Alicyclobacillus cycloheptanicus]MDQ0191302.1 CRISPR-associated protein Csh1 [Alicyclobacillus cycloheptanicus]WDM02419.1 type I-B CRISPR-associated protein Cas8b/Csh1 [Alicyclobacillus cycloheptanicus]
MLDAMVNLGRMLARGEGDENLLQSLIQPMPNVSGKEPYAVFVNLDTEACRLEFRTQECRESDREQIAQEWLWVGNAAGPNSPQWTATTNSLGYLLSQTLVNLYRMLPDNAALKVEVGDVLAQFAVDLGPQPGSEERYRYVLDVVQLGALPSEDWEELAASCRVESEGSIRGKSFVPNLEKAVMKAAQLTANRIPLWTFCINGQRVADHPDYRQLVLRDRVQGVFDEATQGVCSACGAEALVTPNFTRMKFKYYNTDKISFASGVDKKRFHRNLVLCQNCYQALLAAEAFVHGQMRTRVGHLRFYVIPEIFGAVEDVNVREWGNIVQRTVQSVLNFESVATLEDEMEQIREEFSNLGYAVNLLFHVWNNAELRLYNLVRDVPKARFDLLRRTFRRYGRVAVDLLGIPASESKYWVPDFRALYRLIPVTQTNRAQEYRRMLQLFDALLTGQAISYRTLMESFCRLIQIHRFGRYAATNVSAPRAGYELSQLTNDVLLANVILSMLQELGQLAGAPFKREGIDVERDTPLDGDAFLQEVGYRPAQEALFWLGAAIASVANAQRNNRLDSMPVLEKINYRGMNASDIIRLVGKVEEAFQQYKLFNWPKESNVLFRMHLAFAQVLETNPPRWKPEHRLTDEEAVFYILSGLAFRRRQFFGKRNKETLSTDEPSAALYTPNNDVQREEA